MKAGSNHPNWLLTFNWTPFILGAYGGTGMRDASSGRTNPQGLKSTRGFPRAFFIPGYLRVNEDAHCPGWKTLIF
jgi:hypothetical protein